MQRLIKYMCFHGIEIFRNKFWNTTFSSSVLRRADETKGEITAFSDLHHIVVDIRWIGNTFYVWQNGLIFQVWAISRLFWIAGFTCNNQSLRLFLKPHSFFSRLWRTSREHQWMWLYIFFTFPNDAGKKQKVLSSFGEKSTRQFSMRASRTLHLELSIFLRTPCNAILSQGKET